MEKLRLLNVNVISKSRVRKARIAGAIFVAGAALSVSASIEGHEPSIYVPIPREDFMPLPYLSFEPLALNDNMLDRKDLTITILSSTLSSSLVPEVKQLTEKEKKIAEIKAKVKEIYIKAKESGKFNASTLEGLHDNLPFYLAAEEKYGLNWVVSFETQKEESGLSDPNSHAFDASHVNSGVQGSYQIDVSWSQDFRQQAFKGLEYTLSFPQRHKGDAQDTATAVRILYRDIKQSMQNGASYESALSNAVYLYCGSKVEAAKRLSEIVEYDKIFGSLAGNKIKA